MWYASIWIHTLKLPWQLGADFFMKHLVDGDPASNTLSWRWVAGLQTRGKSYLATKSNIHKFTDGRCTLKDHALATLPVEHNFLDYPPNSMKFNEMINIEWDENTGLLITCEDLDLETATDIVFPVQHAYMLVATPEENGVYSNSVLNFKKELCLDVVNNINKKIHSVSNSDEIDLVSWIQENKLKKIVTLSTPVGYINDYINGKKNEMKDYSVEFVKVFREYDMKFWNFANKGFFNFFQKAKTKLAN
jgi:deoxyribodipyrimidine photo-lyase